MNFRQAAKPFVDERMEKARLAFASNDNEMGFKALEDAHVIGQHSTYHHTLVHLKMLQYGLSKRDFREVVGQVFRIIGAVSKTALGLLPEGNTGGARVSAFKSMPISSENKIVLKNIKKAQKKA